MGWNGGDINCPNCDDSKCWWLENYDNGPKYFVCAKCGFTGKGLGNVWVGDFVITHGALIDRFKGVDLEELNLSVIRDAANGLSPGLRLSSGFVEVLRFGEYADNTEENEEESHGP